MSTSQPSPLNLNSEFMKARMKRFAERYDALVAETDMQLIPVLDYGPQGIRPNFMIVEKNPKKEPEVKEEPGPTHKHNWYIDSEKDAGTGEDIEYHYCACGAKEALDVVQRETTPPSE